MNNDGKHWVAAVVDIVMRHITIYDSSHKATQDWFQSNNAECLAVLFPYLLNVGGVYAERAELTNNGTPNLQKFTMSRVGPKAYPQQKVAGDCGIFMLKCFEYLIYDRKFDFNQTHIKLFREKYCVELFQKEFPL